MTDTDQSHGRSGAAPDDGLTPEERLAAAGFTLPSPLTPSGHYAPVRSYDGLVTTSSVSGRTAESRYLGRLGETMNTEQGYESAQMAALNALGALKWEIGELSRVQVVLKLLGYVNSSPDFDEQTLVVNGASDLVLLAFGDVVGPHTRAAIGVAVMPQQCSVGVEITVGLHRQGVPDNT